MPPENNQNFNNQMPPQPILPQEPKESHKALNIILVVLLIILVGVVGFWFYKNGFPDIFQKKVVLQEESVIASDVASNDENVKSEIISFEQVWDLALVGDNKRCSFVNSSIGWKSNIFISKDKMKSEVIYEGDRTLNTLIDGKFEYVWMSSGEFAIKSEITDLKAVAEKMKNSYAQMSEYSLDLPKLPDLECVSWQIDPSVFVLPLDVEFRTLEEIEAASEIPPPVETDPDKQKISKINLFRGQAEVFFDMNMNYGYQGFCNSAKEDYVSLLAKCRDAQDKYVLYAPLSLGKMYCIDHNGLAGEVQVEPTGLSCN